ncbi:hypothetical protein BH18THE2_BH18THE2_17020 [soil metagenome]
MSTNEQSKSQKKLNLEVNEEIFLHRVLTKGLADMIKSAQKIMEQDH